MTMWQPDLARFTGPRYRAIAEALAHDMREGRLRPGDRLPTHRDLAWHLKVTVGTVTRAYAEAERRGLIAGEVGRGTFIRGAEPPVPTAQPPERGPNPPTLLNLAQNHPMPGEETVLFAETLRAIASGPDLGELLQYQNHTGLPPARAAGAAWLALSGAPAVPERVLVTAGGQHCLSTILGAFANPGDVVATEAMTYPGLKAACQLRQVRLEGIAVDEHGVLPDAFAAACRQWPIRLLYLTPNINNPLGGVLPDDRRRAIVEIARRHDVLIVEDDVYGFLIDRPTPFSALAPERTFLVNSLSKSAAPGLRMGYILAPADRIDRLALAVRSTIWMVPPLMVEIATRWIESGICERLAVTKRREAARRQVLARRILGPDVMGHPNAYHIWLPLEERWRASEFVTEARRLGIAVSGANTFTVGRIAPVNGVRVCLGTVADLGVLEDALNTLGKLRDAEPDPLMSVV
ncbi:putative HTH-type transcriptional regulator [Aliidongia dinghuensis]|uniref:Putative HTH-type transcriptional regulator n=1 Tax=Aliidongia dinghuensis TaxID=1867774 RepID=A0A8J3E3J8_9PROT|nr:PLP-dependent aminotransferase family protein [Aliidongia dinghuensis]GGF16963.1 putative HTH-type transcriptional regulator [Aliidongia dinghuensis]